MSWLAQVFTGRATGTRPDYPRTVSTAFEGFASTRLGQFFGPVADEHPGLSGFSLLSHGREAFIVRLALADLAEQSLDMQYYMWDGDTTGRIVVDHVMKAADRGVRVRLLVDDPFYKDSDSVKACLDAHPNVEIRLFNPLTNRRWSILDFIFDFGRVNRRMHNKLMVADNAAAIVGGRNIGDIYYGVNTIANYRDLDVLAVGPVVRDLSGVFDRFWNSPSTVPIAAIVDRAYGAADLGQEAKRRGKAERKMAVRPEDGRRKRATGRTVQFNVMMRPDIKEKIAKAAHRAGMPVTAWIEAAALAYMTKGGA
jgi:putative cardiolipin synthase